MNLYLAVSTEKYFKDIDLSKVYGLSSYHYCKLNPELLRISKFYKEFILDSGIFTYLNGTESHQIDWEQYVSAYADYVKENQIKNYVEVDIDKFLKVGEVERLRKFMENRVGWKSIPVWHMNRGYEKWLEICRDYDYICFGAFITDGLTQDKYPKIVKFLDDAKKQNCKVHGLGMTSGKWLKRLKFHSVDSSSWLSGIRYGSINVFKNGGMTTIQKPKDMKFIDYKEAQKFNLNEWLKYMRYAERRY